jgi:nitrate/nitrite transport system substrate-binding protein
VDGAIEPVLKLGFTDGVACHCHEKGFFAEEGLNAPVKSQANWKVLLDGVNGGQLDGAHAGRATTRCDTGENEGRSHLPRRLISMAMRSPCRTLRAQIEPDSRCDVVFSVHLISASVPKPDCELQEQGKQFKMGMVFPVSTHTQRIALLAGGGGIEPGYTPGDVGGVEQCRQLCPSHLARFRPPSKPAHFTHSHTDNPRAPGKDGTVNPARLSPGPRDPETLRSNL